MCGIAGYITCAPEDVRQEILSGFYEAMEEIQLRGRDATGIAFINKKKEIEYCRAPLKAEEFIQRTDVRELIEEANPSIMIGHCRQGTTGTELKNVNNHPILMKQGGKVTAALIHNGTISNHRTFTEFNSMREGEVDSEVIVLAWHKGFQQG